MLSKGLTTKNSILDRAMVLSSEVGLDGVTIGRLAEDLSLSKSGLFAHFSSKEALQVQIIERAAQTFTSLVIEPSLKHPRGLARLEALLKAWKTWPDKCGLKGCFFVPATVELDDKPGPARDILVRQQRDWISFLAHAFSLAVQQGELRADTDTAQCAIEVYGMYLAYHFNKRLLKNRAAESQLTAAYQALIVRHRR
jgi:AcrR family transcriptional regulator